jgi:hypothetical protein
MLLKIEAREPTLIYLYNLLVPQVQANLERDVPPAELTNLLAVTNEALESVSGGVIWFTCATESCDPRPFQITPEQLGDAGGVISCEYCGELCYRVGPEDLQKPLW